jgi:hypothetical protein
MTVRELLAMYPNATTDDEVSEGYGDGYLPLEIALDEEVAHYWYDEDRNYLEISI